MLKTFLACLIGIAILCASAGFAATLPIASTPAGLPERIETKIPALIEEQLADIERVSTALPGMDRRKAYLITLPLQNYLEDVVLSANRIVLLYPRATAWLIGQEAGRGASKKEISRLLVASYQKGTIRTLTPKEPETEAAASQRGKQ